ncbi:Hypothetical predicted protein [Olea europaea subsp. europaea]|uniref:Uncharacterized protein n=1 Tax=Olea europaea subsp. europaea TaxID=158383 RepID=A0A8S0R2Z3_OLEEU|nr:Hypothetical predicted protein [Olea europaea subsp. europaea]
MQLRTMKLEIIQHVSDELKKLKDFISTVIPTSGSTTTARAANVDLEPRQSDYRGFADYAGHHTSCDDPDKDMGIDRQAGDDMCITEEHMEPCPDEQDMPLPTGIESLQDTADIKPCPDNDPMPVPAGTNKVQVPATGALAGGGVTTTRWRSARLRCPTPATKTPYTRGSAKRKQK